MFEILYKSVHCYRRIAQGLQSHGTTFCKLVGIYCYRLETGTSTCLYKDESRALLIPNTHCKESGWRAEICDTNSQEPTHEPNSCTSSSPEKRWTPSWGCLLLVTSKKCGPDCMCSPHQNHIHTDAPPHLSGGALSSFQVLSPMLQSSFCPKENLTRNSHMVHFFKLTPLYIQYTILYTPSFYKF